MFHFVFRIFLLIGLFVCLNAHPEHKVHNIVLYPDRHSWCKTTAIKQVITLPGCRPIEIDNNVCVGACFSYSIPLTLPSDPGELIRPYCDSCQPSQLTWHHVTLECAGTERGQMEKRVQLISNCSCTACDGRGGNFHHGYYGLPLTLPETDSKIPEVEDGNDDGPELFDLMKEAHRRATFNASGLNSGPANSLAGGISSSSHANNTELVMTKHLVVLLNQLSDKDGEVSLEHLDKHALRELLNEVEGEDHHVNQGILEEVIKKFEEQEHLRVNLAKLRTVLNKYQHEHHRHRKQHLSEADPKIDVASHHLRPALAGTELSYHSWVHPKIDLPLSESQDIDSPSETLTQSREETSISNHKNEETGHLANLIHHGHHKNHESEHHLVHHHKETISED